MAVAGAVAAIAWHFAAAGRPAAATGTPVLRVVQLAAGAVPVLVVPNRPGWNLVHVGLAGASVGAAGGASDGSSVGSSGGSSVGSSGGVAGGVLDGVSVGTEPGRLVAVQRRPGASGGWAAVHLPAGRATLLVAHGGRTAELTMDTGEPPAGAAPPDLTGPDGPECASAALGRLVAGAVQPVASCPADELLAADASALRGIVRFLAGRGQRAITVVADSSPRSVAAAAVLRSESARAGITVATPAVPTAVPPAVPSAVPSAGTQTGPAVQPQPSAPLGSPNSTTPGLSQPAGPSQSPSSTAPGFGGPPSQRAGPSQSPSSTSSGPDGASSQPLVVVAGWAAADGALRTLAADQANAAGGAYLAPWLMHAPVLAGPVAQVIASSYSPAEEPAMAYLAALRDAFPGEPASTSGYAWWLAVSGTTAGGPVRLYAAARLSLPGAAAGHGHTALGWLPGGRLTAVSVPLDVSTPGGR